MIEHWNEMIILWKIIPPLSRLGIAHYVRLTIVKLENWQSKKILSDFRSTLLTKV